MSHFYDNAPLTFDPIPFGEIPGGRPPAAHPGGSRGPLQPAPQTSPPVAPFQQVDPPLTAGMIKTGLLALAVTGAVAGAGWYLWKDHQTVSLARNAADEEPEDDDDGA